MGTKRGTRKPRRFTAELRAKVTPEMYEWVSDKASEFSVTMGEAIRRVLSEHVTTRYRGARG